MDEIKQQSLQRLAALAHETRIDIFRLLVRAGPDGLNAGAIAEALQLANATCSFHLKELKLSGVIGSRRDGRRLVYQVRFDAMSDLVAYLTESCCQGLLGSEGCAWPASAP